MIVNLRIWFIKTYILLYIQFLLWKATFVQEDFAFAFVIPDFIWKLQA